MSLLSYLSQLKKSCNKIFTLHGTINNKNINSDIPQKSDISLDPDIQHKCQIAAQEIKYMNNYIYWPITKTVKNKASKTLVYLRVDKNKRVPIERNNSFANNSSDVFNKNVKTNK